MRGPAICKQKIQATETRSNYRHFLEKTYRRIRIIHSLIIMSIPLEKDYAEALTPPAVPRQLVHEKKTILQTLPDTTIWHCPKETERLLALLPHLVPGRFRSMMEGMTVPQMCKSILSRSHWRVKEIQSVQNPHLEAHHDLFLQQHRIKISHTWNW